MIRLHTIRIPMLMLALFALASCLAAASAMAQATRPSQPPPPATQPEADDDETPDDDELPDRAYALIETSEGDIHLELFGKEAPKTVANFIEYIEDEHYDGTIFHRVIPHFMIQGGGYTPDMQKKPTREPIENEWTNGLSHERGTVAMARLGGRPDSATNQFFINVADNDGSGPINLDRPQRDGAGYAVFGKVIAGMDVVDAIRVTPTRTVGRMRNVPVEPVVIERIREVSEDEAQRAVEKERQPADPPRDASRGAPQVR